MYVRTIETFICKGIENIEGIINDGWQLATI